MILRAILVDDEQMGIDTLQLLLKMVAADRVKVVATSTKPAAAIELIEDYRPELVFLDINMPGLNGFELLDKLNYKGFDLIFTTAHQEFALQALRNGAFDYLLKPIDKTDLLETLLRIATRNQLKDSAHAIDSLESAIDQQQKTRININSKASVEYLDADTLVYLEAESNYTRVHVSNGETIVSPRTLKDFEAELCNDTRFMRVHQSYIVNLQKVARYLKSSEEVVLSNNQTLPISRSKKEAFTAWLNR